MDFNTKIFLKINSLVGRSKLLDSFGRAGAEWLIVAMIAWYGGAVLISRTPGTNDIVKPLAFLVGAAGAGWLLNLGIALSVREPRPYLSYPYIKVLFKPLMNWRSFPSDHSFAAFLIFFMACVFHLPGAWALGVMAVWVVWGRVFAGVHYPLDIIGGATVAGLIALISNYLIKVIV
jgi:membrane-associated phospholipid phosphatase